MGIISGGNVIEGGLGPYQTAGAPSAGTDEIQTVTVALESGESVGSYRLQFEGLQTEELADDAAAATVQTALRALGSVGSTGVTVSGSAGGPYTVTFVNEKGKQAVGLLVATEQEGVDVTIEETTPGVNASARGALKGATLIDTTNGVHYINTGTAAAPTWTKTGTQS